MEDRYSETFNTWDKVALLYQDKFMDLNIYNDTYDLVCHSISKDKANILEIGCGPGNITKYIKSKRSDVQIFGIDMSPNMIELARKNNPTSSFEIMDCRNIDKITTKFDGIICGFCLPYLSPFDSQKLMADCRHLLNENSVLYVSFVEGDPNKSDFQISPSGDRVYFYYHQLNNMKKQLIEYKFEEIKTFHIQYSKIDTEIEIHTIIIAKKKRP